MTTGSADTSPKHTLTHTGYMPSTPPSPKAFPAALGPASPDGFWRKVFKASIAALPPA